MLLNSSRLEHSAHSKCSTLEHPSFDARSALYSVKKEQLIIATDFIPFDLLPLPSSPIDGFYFHQSTSTPPASAHVQTDLDRLLLKLTHELIKIHRSDQVARIPPGVAIEGFLPVPTAEEPNCINRL